MDIYVDVRAGRDGNGSKEMPFRRINEAAKVAKPGDTVLVAPGVYREYVDPIFAGEPDARITYKSTEPLKAVITGAERITSWKHYQDNVWVCRVPNSTFGAYNPYTTFVYGDWYFAKADKHTGCVYLNDRALYETSSLEDCIRAKFMSAAGFQRNLFTSGIQNRIRKQMRLLFMRILREQIRTRKMWKLM